MHIIFWTHTLLNTVNCFNYFNSTWYQINLQTSSACSNPCSAYRQWVPSDRSQKVSSTSPDQYPTENSSLFPMSVFRDALSHITLLAFSSSCQSVGLLTLYIYLEFQKKSYHMSLHTLSQPMYVYALDTGDHILSLNFRTTIFSCITPLCDSNLVENEYAMAVVTQLHLVKFL
jgi:hypothetical protein